MLPLNFRRIRKYLAPRWLTEGDGELVGYSLDVVKDAFVERARQGQLVGFPENGSNGETAPDDALTRIGQDRRVVRGISETAQSYAVRLKNWLIDRRTSGNAFTLMKQLAAYCDSAGLHGCSFRTVDVRGNWYSRAADGTQTSVLQTGNWHWDTDTARWARFWVIIYPGTLWAPYPFNWGDAAGPNWGAHAGEQTSTAPTIGSTAIADHVTTLRAIVADWKPANTICQSIILAFDSASFNPASPEANDGLWKNWSKVVAGVRVPARLSTARYLRGTS